MEGLPDFADLPDLVIPDVDSCTGNDTVLYTIYWRNCTVSMLSDVFINLEILNTPLILVIMVLQDNNIFKQLTSGIMDSLTGFQDNLVQSWQAEPWWRASIWRSHRKVIIKQCSYHNNIIDIQNRLPYSKVVYPAIIVLFSCLMEANHGVRTGPDYPFREIKSHFEVVPRYTCRLFTLKRNHMPRK